MGRYLTTLTICSALLHEGRTLHTSLPYNLVSRNRGGGRVIRALLSRQLPLTGLPKIHAQAPVVVVICTTIFTIPPLDTHLRWILNWHFAPADAATSSVFPVSSCQAPSNKAPPQ